MGWVLRKLESVNFHKLVGLLIGKGGLYMMRNSSETEHLVLVMIQIPQLSQNPASRGSSHKCSACTRAYTRVCPCINMCTCVTYVITELA